MSLLTSMVVVQGGRPQNKKITLEKTIGKFSLSGRCIVRLHKMRNKLFNHLFMSIAREFAYFLMPTPT